MIGFLRHFPVSHETLVKLDRYAALLFEWNAKFNLVSENSLAHVWQRHFLDSAQLIKFIPQHARTIADLGSGAMLTVRYLPVDDTSRAMITTGIPRTPPVTIAQIGIKT